jgi:hypothetical protein
VGKTMTGQPPHRMSRDEFFATLAPLDESRLRKALWNLYWRGSASIRERIETELKPEPTRQPRRAEPRDGASVLSAVQEFTALARDGAYMAGDRRVSRNERSKWRVTFRKLATEAQAALHDADTAPAEAAVGLLIDLACDAGSSDYFHSDDPVEAARFVVSQAASALWQAVMERQGFFRFADIAAAQLIRWEHEWGWTRHGNGKVAELETSLAEVLEGILTTPDEWMTVADAYLLALDVVALQDAPARSRVRSGSWDRSARTQKQRTKDLARWHQTLVANLPESGAADRLDRLVVHPALAGPELTFLRGQVIHQRGDQQTARKLVSEALSELPGHHGFIAFAVEIGADLPARSRELAAQWARYG